MSASPRILAFAGSLRKGSFNRKLVRLAAAGAKAAGAQVETLDLADYPLPIFDQDFESDHGAPETAIALKAKLAAADGLLIASPEYNSSVTAALKNAIDWASRPAEDEPPLVAFKGKVAGLMATSPGALGGLRGLVHLRAILGNIGVIVLPDQLAIPKSHEAFDDVGDLTDVKQQDRVKAIGRAVAEMAARLKN